MNWQEFRVARKSLGLSVSQLAVILDTNPVTIRKWETPPDYKTSRSPNPIACQVLRWLTDGRLKLND